MRVVGVVLALALGACVTTPIPGADAVVITSNNEMARECRFLGQENHYVSTMPASLATEDLPERARRSAALKGGNLVVSPGPQVGPQGALGYPMVTMNADVYACPIAAGG